MAKGDGSDGDSFKRRWDGDVAQCGCQWTRQAEWGDVLVQCAIHQQATNAWVAEFERERAGQRSNRRGR